MLLRAKFMNCQDSEWIWIPKRTLRLFPAFSDSKVPWYRPTYPLKATRNFEWNTPKKSTWRHWRVNEASGCYRARFPERKEVPRVRPTFSVPLPLKQCEAKRLDKPSRTEGFAGGEASQGSAGGMELWRPELEFRCCQGKGALINIPDFPGGIPKGYFLVTKENRKLTSALWKTEAQL